MYSREICTEKSLLDLQLTTLQHTANQQIKNQSRAPHIEGELQPSSTQSLLLL